MDRTEKIRQQFSNLPNVEKLILDQKAIEMLSAKDISVSKVYLHKSDLSALVDTEELERVEEYLWRFENRG